MGVLVYGFEVGIFLCGRVWVFQWFYIVGLTMGILVRLGLRYRLLWFWVFRWVFPRVLPMGLGWV